MAEDIMLNDQGTAGSGKQTIHGTTLFYHKNN